MCFLWKLSIDFIRSFIDGSSTSLVLNFCNFFSKFSILSLFLKCSWFRFSPILYGLSACSADSVLCCTETFKRHVVSAADTWGHFLFCLESSSLHGVLLAASSFGFSRFKWKVWLWVYNHTAWMHAVSSGPDLISLICEGVRSYGMLGCCWQLHNMVILWIMNFTYQISLSNIPWGFLFSIRIKWICA